MKSGQIHGVGDVAKTLRASLAPSYLAAEQVATSMKALREQIDSLNQAARDRKSAQQTKALPPSEF